MVLTYADAAANRGKATADSDVVEVRFVDLVPGVRVVQAVDFVSDDPDFAGTMTMTWAVSAVDAGALVEIRADDVPDGISAEDHAAGTRVVPGQPRRVSRTLIASSPGRCRFRSLPIDVLDEGPAAGGLALVDEPRPVRRQTISS